jgi:uncharacterized phage protein (TIGR02218 family)
MTMSLTAVAENFLEIRTKRLTTLWRLTRQDGTPFHFTTHDHEIVFDSASADPFGVPDLQTYTPVAGVEASAKRRELGLKESNLDVRGIISSSAITSEDLRAGKYRNAKIDEFMVDHKYPFAGAIIHNVYHVEDVTDDGNMWTATVAGTASRLKQKTGELYSRDCPFTVFASGGARNCRKDRAGYFRTKVVVDTIIKPRLEFTAVVSSLSEASGVAGVPDASDDFFTLGKVLWDSGANGDASIVSEVRGYVHATREIKLRLKTPYDIAVGDGFEIEAGCDKTKATCITKFFNLPNFGGFSFLTEPQETIRGPIAQPV